MFRHLRNAAVIGACVLTLGLNQSLAEAPVPRKFQLDNGLRVVFQRNQPTQTVVLCAFVRATVLHELRQGIGIRHLTQQMLGRASGHEQELRQVAARVETATASDYVELIIAAPVEGFEDCARILREVLFTPQLSAAALEVERARLIRAVAARAEVSETHVLDALYERLYPGLGAGHYGLGEPETVAGITLEQIRSFHTTHYLPNCTVISVSGGITADDCERALVQPLASLLPGGRAEEAPAPPPASGPNSAQLPGPSATGIYALGGRAVDLTSPLYPAASTAMALLGSGMDSRLYKALRRDRSLAYTIITDITPSTIAPTASVLVTCDRDKLAEVARVVEREIERLMTKPPPADELRRAKRYMVGKHALRHQSNYDIAHYLGVFELLGGAAGYRLDTLLPARIAAVRAEAVRDAMASMFEERAVVRLGDLGR